MPVYVYECNQCGVQFDKLQPFSASPLTECESCGQGPIRRVFQPVGVIFKGSGWYITDSRKSESAKSDSAGAAAKSSGTNSADSADSADSAAKSDDAKPASASDSSAAASVTPTKAATPNTASAD